MTCWRAISSCWRGGDSQSNLASKLFVEFSDLNVKLLQEAIAYKNAGSVPSFDGIARVPGETMVIFADRANLNTTELSDLLGEKILVTQAEEDISDTVKNVLGSDFDVDFYPTKFTEENEESQNAVAVFPKNKVNATSLKIAQQIAGVPIIAAFTQPQKVTQPLPNVSSRPSGGSTKSNNAFKSDFAKIDEMFERPRKSNEGIKKALQKLETKVSNQRNAEAMNQIAIYYGRIRAHDDRDRCFALAEMYAR